MHVAVFALFAIILGGVFSYAVAGFMVGLSHLFGHRDSYYYGVWTIPDALVVDLAMVTVVVTCFAWILIGTLFIHCAKWANRSSWWRIAPYEVSSTWKQFGNNLSSILHHSPILRFEGGKAKLHLRAVHIMLSKTLLIALGTITFGVMPCCTVATIHREQNIRERSKYFENSDRKFPIPLTCGEMYPSQVPLWSHQDAKNFKGTEKIFESLCWRFEDIFQFCSVFGLIYGFVITILCLLSVVVQHAPRSSTN